MSAPRQILAAIFDMDGLIMDSEPLWDRAELEVMASLGLILPAAMSYRIPLACALMWLLACGSHAALERSGLRRGNPSHHQSRHYPGGRDAPAAARRA
jgi:beta-phosphoglucomutase-like phosphatase (HAD superfamily)